MKTFPHNYNYYMVDGTTFDADDADVAERGTLDQILDSHLDAYLPRDPDADDPDIDLVRDF